MIDKALWESCNICGASISDIKKSFGGNGKYLADAMKNHILQHDISLEEYFEKITERPTCRCGICNKKCNITTKRNNTSGIFWREYACGRFEGSMKYFEKSKTLRRGSGNPMYGKKAWNNGLTKETSDIVSRMSAKSRGRSASIQTRKRQSESAKKRKVHGHTGKKHSENSKEKMRIKTLEMIKNGKFKQTETLPHRLMRSILIHLELEYEEEKNVKYWSFDFYIPSYNLYIEVDGDYFHSNPKLYPNGPKSKTQKVNWYRDIKKNDFVLKNQITLLRFWESDIINNPEECAKRIISYER